MNWHFFPSKEWFADGDDVVTGVSTSSRNSLIPENMINR